MKSIDEQYQTAIDSGDENLGLELAIEQASTRGYDIQAYHGTYSRFSEFKEGDVGFHFSKSKYVAMNRLDDIYSDILIKDIHSDPAGTILNVALSIHNPMVLNCDFGEWYAKNIFKMARTKITNVPYASPSETFVMEQRFLAKNAYRMLKSIGYSKQNILDIYDELNSDSTDLNIARNQAYTLDIRRRMTDHGYDGIIYKNDYESEEGEDATSYIVFLPS